MRFCNLLKKNTKACMENYEFYVSDDVVDHFSLLLETVQTDSKMRDISNHCLSSNCFASNNLLRYDLKERTNSLLDEILEECSNILNTKLKYYYLHMINYQNGGDMLIHRHDHNEDYSYVLYLNSCDDGHTTLYLNPPIRIKPEKGKVILFSSNVYHSGMFSRNKKILVGGLRKTNEKKISRRY